MNTGLKGKIVLVTGSSRGLGASVAKAFAEQGSTIIVNYINNHERAKQLVTQLTSDYGVEAIAIQADVTDESEVLRMIREIEEEFLGLDIVVNNALQQYIFDPDQRKLAWEMEWNDYQQQLDGSLKGTFNVCKHAVPLMKVNGFGRIINVVSNLIFRPLVPYHDYTTAKGAVLTYSQNLAAELGPFGIHVNCVAPGLIYPTDASRTTKEEVKQSIMAQTPLGRIARPEDIAGSILFLGSQWSSFVTGQCLVVDGGLIMK
jgi:3-oxoacyl-[acyl-carrier protein] reductase